MEIWKYFLTGYSLACLSYHVHKYEVPFMVDFINSPKILVNERYIDKPSIFNSSLKNKGSIQQMPVLAMQ